MKTDAHHHLLMGASRTDLERTWGVRLPCFQTFDPDAPDPIGRLNRWIRTYYAPLCRQEDFLDVVLKSAFLTAQADGVERLEASVNVNFPRLFRVSPAKFLEKIDSIHRKTAPGMEFKLDIGLLRTADVTESEREMDALLEAPLAEKCIGGIDLYDVENACEPEKFQNLFRKAKAAGLKLKAHAGESGTAESVRHAVEILDLDAVQHGIHACESPEVMRWLAERGTILNLAPESNRVLGTIDFSQKPIEKLRDSGVPFTLNTDDYLLFETSISDQERRYL